MLAFTRNDISRVNPGLLKEELATALGYEAPFTTEREGGIIVSLAIDAVEQEYDTVVSVLAAHDPDALSQTEQLAALMGTIQAASKEHIKAIPGWARWTVEEAGEWYGENVSDLLPVANLADANIVLANMAQAQWAEIQMLLEIRNRLWPELEAGGE